jgi:hypothetical protein
MLRFELIQPFGCGAIEVPLAIIEPKWTIRALCSGYFDWMTSKITRLFLKEKFKMALCKAFVTLGSYPYQHGTDYHKKNTV